MVIMPGDFVVCLNPSRPRFFQSIKVSAPQFKFQTKRFGKDEF